MDPSTLKFRIQAALADPATPTPELGKLYFECYGQPCHQRPRLEHYLRQYVGEVPTRVPARPTGNPSISTPVAHKFKDFAKDYSVIVHQEDGSLKEVHAGNLTPYDAAYIIKDGKGHLLEEVNSHAAKAAQEAAKPELSTRTSGGKTEVAPDLVPNMVPSTAPASNDALEHDEAEQKAREKQAEQADKADEAPALKVAVVEPTHEEKPEVEKPHPHKKK